MKKFNSVTGEVKYLVMDYMEKEGGKEGGGGHSGQDGQHGGRRKVS